MKTLYGEINGSPVIRVYRATEWTQRDPVRVFVTEDRKIWLGFGYDPERFSHAGDAGDDLSKEAVLRVANS